jgi:myosin heavy subunit
MNAVSQALRIIAIVAALAAAGLYFLSDKKAAGLKAQINASTAQVAAVQQQLTAANTKDATDAQNLQAANADLDKAKADSANYAALLTQARNAADTATHASQDANNQIQDLNNQITTLKQQAASVDDLKAQITSLQAQLQAGPASSSSAAGASNTTTASSGTTTGATPTTSSSPSSFSTTPSPTQIIQLDARHGLIVVGVGTNSGLANDAQLALQKSGTQIAQIQITDAEPDYSVAMILSGSTVKQLKKGDTVDFLRIR